MISKSRTSAWGLSFDSTRTHLIKTFLIVTKLKEANLLRFTEGNYLERTFTLTVVSGSPSLYFREKSSQSYLEHDAQQRLSSKRAPNEVAPSEQLAAEVAAVTERLLTPQTAAIPSPFFDADLILSDQGRSIPATLAADLSAALAQHRFDLPPLEEAVPMEEEEQSSEPARKRGRYSEQMENNDIASQ
mgnify:FL=1